MYPMRPLTTSADYETKSISSELVFGNSGPEVILLGIDTNSEDNEDSDDDDGDGPCGAA